MSVENRTTASITRPEASFRRAREIVSGMNENCPRCGYYQSDPPITNPPSCPKCGQGRLMPLTEVLGHLAQPGSIDPVLRAEIVRAVKFYLKSTDELAADALEVEGLAAQLMQHDCDGLAAFWHLVREDAKQKYRKWALRRIVEFNKQDLRA